MNKLTLAVVVAAIVGVGALVQVNAAPGSGNQQRGAYFEKIDTNGDGKVSQQEHNAFHQSRLQERFTSLDGDGDGSVSEQEFVSSHNERKQNRFEKMDANGDGYVTQDERGMMRNKYAGKGMGQCDGKGPRN